MSPVRRGVARHAYSLLLTVLKPAYLAKLWWRGRDEPLYRHAVLERLGLYRGRPSRDWVWVHAVSLGETRAAAGLIEALRRELPGMRLLLTNGTATGREAGEKLLQPGDRQAWLPYDTPGVVQRFFAQFQPRVGVLMETEVWPNLLHGAHDAGVPMVLANARLSEKSLRQAKRLDAVMRPAVRALHLVLAQTEADAARLREAGAAVVEVCGNIKFDMTPAPELLERGRAWRAALAGRPVVAAASTREGEEEPLLAAWRRLPSPRPLLLLVPRHPQRFDEVAGAVKAAGLMLARRSSWGGDAPGDTASAVDVWLGDTIGEMPAYYAAADVALLGGSFAPLGGQNLIEAAACGCPVVMGPHTFNFADAAELSLAAGASVRVADVDEGVDRAVALAQSAERGAWVSNCLSFSAAHRGAAATMAARIAALAADAPVKARAAS
ncbi:3-deoxy-D-manno-octulosonic acid transferase [Caldimonas brevitalea]|uniref:3-deoxy-D-manno-octulosonic acid transferase n=1 Tax=Caldimonas brevitalea TaxID=413882 RepID=A0A0G3BFW4_9BURK|nr:3-deoxy-D-manno-octulosonic acid transferase [Caldimonas brevitalea]AKJ28299.1 3-deoxy-D-manno-octulosonic acid transferase [Caldimonas brevitalea]